MTRKSGFLIGLATGFLLIATILGQGNVTQESRDFAKFIGTIAIVIALVISILKPFRRGSVINPTADGFFAGVGVSAAITTLVLYGVSFP